MIDKCTKGGRWHHFDTKFSLINKVKICQLKGIQKEKETFCFIPDDVSVSKTSALKSLINNALRGGFLKSYQDHPAASYVFFCFVIFRKHLFAYSYLCSIRKRPGKLRCNDSHLDMAVTHFKETKTIYSIDKTSVLIELFVRASASRPLTEENTTLGNATKGGQWNHFRSR